MSVESLPVFEVADAQSLLIWAIAELIITLLWLFLQARIPLGWYSPAQLLRLCLVPYLALLAGQISPQAMGLGGYDWSNSLAIGSLLFVVVIAVWIGIRTTEEAPDAEVVEVPNHKWNAAHWSLNGLILLSAGGWQLNWSFWRAAFAQFATLFLVQLESPFYWGVSLAALFVLLEIIVAAPSSVARLTNIAILIATSVLFLFTRNFWLCWAMHGFLQLTALPDSRWKV